MAEIEPALAEEKLIVLSELGHRLKSPARSVGASGFAEQCAALENAAKMDDLSATRAHAAQLRESLPFLVARIELEFGSLNKP